MAKVQKSADSASLAEAGDEGREVGMEPWKDDLTRLAWEFQTAHRGLEHATVEIIHAVARLRSIVASDAVEQQVASRLEQHTP